MNRITLNTNMYLKAFYGQKVQSLSSRIMLTFVCFVLVRYIEIRAWSYDVSTSERHVC